MLDEGMGQMGKQSMGKHATRMEQGLDGVRAEQKPHSFWVVSGFRPMMAMHDSFFWVVSERYEVHQLV